MRPLFTTYVLHPYTADGLALTLSLQLIEHVCRHGNLEDIVLNQARTTEANTYNIWLYAHPQSGWHGILKTVYPLLTSNKFASGITWTPDNYQNAVDAFEVASRQKDALASIQAESKQVNEALRTRRLLEEKGARELLILVKDVEVAENVLEVGTSEQAVHTEKVANLLARKRALRTDFDSVKRHGVQAPNGDEPAPAAHRLNYPASSARAPSPRAPSPPPLPQLPALASDHMPLPWLELQEYHPANHAAFYHFFSVGMCNTTILQAIADGRLEPDAFWKRAADQHKVRKQKDAKSHTYIDVDKMVLSESDAEVGEVEKRRKGKGKAKPKGAKRVAGSQGAPPASVSASLH